MPVIYYAEDKQWLVSVMVDILVSTIHKVDHVVALM